MPRGAKEDWAAVAGSGRLRQPLAELSPQQDRLCKRGRESPALPQRGPLRFRPVPSHCRSPSRVTLGYVLEDTTPRFVCFLSAACVSMSLRLLPPACLLLAGLSLPCRLLRPSVEGMVPLRGFPWPRAPLWTGQSPLSWPPALVLWTSPLPPVSAGRPVG